jgi:hypothetical protein
LAARENVPTRKSLALSHADACNPLLQAHPTWAQDNTKAAGSPFGLSPSPLRAPSRADPSGLGHTATIYSSVQGAPGVKTPTVGTPGRGLLRVNEQLPVKVQMGSLQQPFQPGMMLRFGSLEFMSLDGGYDMILLPSPHDSDNGGRQPARRRRNQRRLPQKNNIRVCPITSPADGGGGGATMAKQEAAPRRLSSESTAPAPQRGTCRAMTSRLRRRRAPFPRNTPTPSKRTTPARSRGTCWASPSYLRRRCSPPLTRLHHRLSTKRYRPVPISCLLDPAATHQATPLRWTLS